MIDKDTIIYAKNIRGMLTRLNKKKCPDVISVLKMKQSNRLDFFDSMMFEPDNLQLSEEIMLKMERLRLIQKVGSKYTITLKLLVVTDYPDAEDVNLGRFIDDLNDEFFYKLYKERIAPLSSDEKAIILTLMGLMSFDEHSAFKADSTEQSRIFAECVNKAAKLLISFSYDDGSLSNIWSINARQEDKVTAKLARLDYIKIRTGNIYDKQPRYGHFLRILKDGQLDEQKLNELMNKIFDKGPLTLEHKHKLIEVLDEIYLQRHKLLTANNIDVGIRSELHDFVKRWIFG